MLRATTPSTFSTSQLPKLLRTPQFLTHFTSKCASRHNAVHFFNISTSKTAPNPSVFNTFYFQMCFAPQRRALFQHLNFQNWSDAAVFCTFSLRNRLRATTACNFSSLISPDVSAPAALASLLFNPPEPQNHEKTQCFATFLPFRAPASSFFWSFLFWLSSLLTAFSSLHIVGSLTSKLPSTNRPACSAGLFEALSKFNPLIIFEGVWQCLRWCPIIRAVATSVVAPGCFVRAGQQCEQYFFHH